MSKKMNYTIPHKKPLRRGITLAGSKTKPANCFQLPNQSATTQSKPTLQTEEDLIEAVDSERSVKAVVKTADGPNKWDQLIDVGSQTRG